MIQQQYEIQSILASKFSPAANRYYYLVKWVNWQVEDSTWEPQENLYNAQEIIDQYKQKQLRDQKDFEWEKIQKFKQFWQTKVILQKKQNIRESNKKKLQKSKKIQKDEEFSLKKMYYKKQKRANQSKDKTKQIVQKKIEQQDQNMPKVIFSTLMGHLSSYSYFPQYRNESQQNPNQVDEQLLKLAPEQNAIIFHTKNNLNQVQNQTSNNLILNDFEQVKSHNIITMRQTFGKNHGLLFQSQKYDYKAEQKKEQQNKPSLQENNQKHQNYKQNQEQNIYQSSSNQQLRFNQQNFARQPIERSNGYTFVYSSSYDKSNNQDAYDSLKKSEQDISQNGQNFYNMISSFSQYNSQRPQNEPSSIQSTNNLHNVSQILAKQSFEILGIRRTASKIKQEKLKYCVRDKYSRKSFWQTKRQVIKLCPVSLINYYQKRMVFNKNYKNEQ